VRPGIRKRGTAYEAWVYDKRTKTKIRKTFQSHAEAPAWRDEAKGAVRKGALRAATRRTVREPWDEWLAGAKDGSIRTRGGKPFKPSTIRSYSTSIELHVLDDFGAARLSDVSRVDLQDAAERMLGEGATRRRSSNALMPLPAIYRRALARGEVAVNPTSGLELPTVGGRRDRTVTREEAALLVAAVPEQDRALWAAALYSGLRRSELMALREKQSI
jgi:hypothetical protein